MKILYLIPPSEGKNSGGNTGEEKLSFHFEKPVDIAINATEKDLKCTGKRYEEGMKLNKKLCTSSPSIPLDEGEESYSVELEKYFSAMLRYSGVMFSAIDYENMGENTQNYFNENFLILSGMYGIVKPRDAIGNYKLPIETKGLKDFWGVKITDELNKLDADYIIDLLPNSYKKVVNWKLLNTKIVRIDFYEASFLPLGENCMRAGKKLTHGVKKVKGDFINVLCKLGPESLEDFPGQKVQISENEYHISISV